MDERRTWMRTAWWAAVVAAMATAAPLAAEPLAAQARLPQPPPTRPLAPSPGRGRGGADIPPAYRPPPGMCRIWLDNVPPAQQPAPTDCASAVRNRPANGRVIFGDDYVGDGANASSGAPGRSYALRAGTSMPGMGTGMAYPGAVVRLARVHGPAADDGEGSWMAWGDSTVPRRGVTPRPAARPASAPPAARRAADDEWEAGYAAGYRDAMRGRRPRVRGVDRAEGRAAGRGATGGGDTLDDLRDAGRAPGGGVYGGYGVGAGIGVGTGGDGAVVVVPPGADPRYFNNGRNPPPGRANGVCLDRDADGWCDDPRFGAPVCRDLDGDGRCDDVPALAAAPFPAALPDMRAATEVLRGAGSATALRWLGTTEVIARVTDLRRTGVPSRVTWLDANTGALLQVWSDRDGDGVADRVEVYRGGRRVKLIGR